MDARTFGELISKLGPTWKVNENFNEWFDYDDNDVGGAMFVKGEIIGRQAALIGGWDYQPNDDEPFPAWDWIPIYKYVARVDFDTNRINIYEGRVYPGKTDNGNYYDPMYYYHLCLSQMEIDEAMKQS